VGGDNIERMAANVGGVKIAVVLGYPAAVTSTAYHHGNLRETLVEAAVGVVRESGPEGLALRDLARRVGVSHNAAYRHFADRDELVAEVAGRVMGSLVDAIHRRLAMVRTTDPVLRARHRLAETGRGYVEFALAEPGLFRLAFASPSTVAMAASAPGRDPLQLLSEGLDELVDVGFLSPEARVDAEGTCWSAVHGFASLHLDGAFQVASAEELSAALDRVLVAIDRSYGASTGTPTDPSDLRISD